jgi:hypothetical protein
MCNWIFTPFGYNRPRNYSKEPSFRCMNDSNPIAPKPILKLKAGVRKSPPETKSAPHPKPQSKVNQKSGAAWSDEYKQRMQEDMDALIRR